MHIRAFTLVEIILTLTVVGLLTGVVFYLSWNRIGYMHTRIEKENAIDNINQMLQNIMAVKWYNEQALQKGSIVFTSGSQDIKSLLVFSGITQAQSLFTFYHLIPERIKDSEKMEIVRTPYDVSCNIFADVGNQKLALSGFLFRGKKNHTITYCFVVDTFPCKIREIACKK